MSASVESEFPDSEIERVLAAMSAAWHDGRRVPAEQWLDEHAELATNGEDAVRLIYEEVCLREQQGEMLDSSEYYRRFPQWHDALQVVFDCHRLMEGADATAEFPEAGQRLGELELLREIGRGARGRVFLASQPSLSERLLVAKITPQSGTEHLSLARLQHSHIAPLYLIQDFPRQNLRALCMPYLGGLSWSDVLTALREVAPPQRTGRHIVEVVNRCESYGQERAPVAGPTLQFLSRSSYVEAVAWIGASLADALHYAHQRGLVHLDVKPSNLLLAADGQPMLLDFHLAHETLVAASGTIDRLGGTRGYMSPEQEQLAMALDRGQRSATKLDARSDVYSLGVLLYESLAGGLPPRDDAQSRRTLARHNPQVSRGLSDIVHKCLAPDVEHRYADAGQLGADLRRHLASLPLTGVPNRSLGERWTKWRRRQPHSLPLLVIGLVLPAMLAAAASIFYTDRLQVARASLSQAVGLQAGGDFAGARQRLEAGWSAIQWLPGHEELKLDFKRQLESTDRARLADALHTLVEKLHFVEATEDVPIARLREIDAGCRQIWDAREQIAGSISGSQAVTDQDQCVRRELLDLVALWIRLQLRMTPDESKGARVVACRAVLEEADTRWGPNAMLALARVELNARPGQDVRRLVAAMPRPQTSWEYFALGRFWFNARDLQPASAAFAQAVRLAPQSFWPTYYLMVSHYQLEQFDEALRLAYACVALAPTSGECFRNRALCHLALGNRIAAEQDFAQAGLLDPALVSSGVATSEKTAPGK